MAAPMSFRGGSRRCRVALSSTVFACALPLLSPTLVAAQERGGGERSARGAGDSSRPRILNVLAGYGFQARQSCWNGAAVDIENPGPAVRGVLRFENSGGQTAQAIAVAREVRLPARSRSRIYLPLYPDREPPETEKISELAVASLGDGAAVTWSEFAILGQVLPDRQPTYLVCEAEARSYNIVKHRVVAGREHECSRAVVRPADLPARAGDLDAADILILGSPGDHRLDVAQAETIRQWLEKGGVLAVVPGAGFEPDALGPIEPLLPALYGPAVLAESLPSILAADAPPFQAPDGILVRPMTLRGGRALIGSPESPLVAERAVGEGRIVAFAFDAGDDAFQNWPGASAFWSRCVPLPSDNVRRASRRLADRAVLPPLIQELAGIEVVSRRAVRAYLLTVTVLVMTPILLGRLFGRPAAGWAAGLALALCAGFAAVRAGRPPADASAAQLIEIYEARGRSGRAGFAVQSALGLYAPLGGDFRVRGLRDSVRPRPGAEFTTPPERFEAWWSDRLELPTLRVRPRAVRAFAVESFAPGVSPEIEATFGADGLRVRVRNPVPATLEDAFVRVERLAVPLGDVPPNSERLVVVRPEMPRIEMAQSARAVRRLRDVARDRMFAALYPPFDASALMPSGYSRSDDFASEWASPVLAYWSETPLTPLASEAPEAARRALGLVRVAAEARYESGRICWPRGALPARVERRAGAVRAHADGFYMGRDADEMVLVFTLPAEAPDIAVESLRVFRAFEADDAVLTVALLPAGGGALLELPDAPVFAVERPERFYNARERAVRLVARVAPRAGAPDRSWARNWIIRDLDIELAGRATGGAPAGESSP